jgi:ubiquinone/menaquinone biosynthesis C-methylase UbiE
MSAAAEGGQVRDLARRHALTYGEDVEQYAAVNEDRSFADPLLDRLGSLLSPGAIVADLGCGPGWEAESFERRGFRAIGVDLTPEFLAFASRAHPASGYLAGDFLALPFGGGALDGAWACSSLVHVPWAEIDTALLEVARILRPGGAFLATMQAGSKEGPTASRTFPGKAFHYAYYKPGDWHARLERAGFAIDWLNYHEAAAEHCNPGAHGWIESLAVKR